MIKKEINCVNRSRSPINVKINLGQKHQFNSRPGSIVQKWENGCLQIEGEKSYSVYSTTPKQQEAGKEQENGFVYSDELFSSTRKLSNNQASDFSSRERPQSRLRPPTPIKNSEELQATLEKIEKPELTTFSTQQQQTVFAINQRSSYTPRETVIKPVKKTDLILKDPPSIPQKGAYARTKTPTALPAKPHTKA